MLQNAETSRTARQLKWKGAQDAELEFRMLKWAFSNATILNYFDPGWSIILQTDARRFAMGGILTQCEGFRIPRLVTFYSHQCTGAKEYCDSYVCQLIAIVETTKQCPNYLKGASLMVLKQCDHKNIEYFQTSTVLSRREARVVEIIPSYDFVFEYLESKQDSADGLSRRPDYEIRYENMTAKLVVTLAVTTITD